jgi:hypothetical protein
LYLREVREAKPGYSGDRVRCHNATLVGSRDVCRGDRALLRSIVIVIGNYK